jgi:methyl-accepting chemotaxis protein
MHISIRAKVAGLTAGLIASMARARPALGARGPSARTAEGAATVDRAREAFEHIEHGVSELAASSQEIAAAAQQIQSRTADVEVGIGSVARVAETSSAIAEEVSASAQEITASAQELSSTAASLEQLVGRFPLTGP